ncbi:MAG TPA: hypothetical protein VKX17_16815 [Planctomycetota bacterium]|nr:hypothetical protein [Planctomycetota bacterium]
MKRFALVSMLATLTQCVCAAAFDPRPPLVTAGSAEILFAIGAIATLVLLDRLLRKPKGRRFSFSLRWLLALSGALGFLIGGITRFHLAIQQEQDYRDAVALKNQLARKVSFCLLDTPLTDALGFMNQVGKYDATLDPKLAAEGMGNTPINCYRFQDIRADSAFKLIAKSAGLQCENKGGRITLVRRSRETLAADAELEAKLATIVSIDFSATPLLHAIYHLRGLTKLELEFQDDAAQAKMNRTITVRLHDVEARSALKWVMRYAEIQFDELYELPGDAQRARTAQQEESIQKKLEACKVSFDFKDKPLVDCVDFIAKAANVNILIDPNALAYSRTPITLRVNEMSAGLTPITLRVNEMSAELAQGHSKVVSFHRRNGNASEHFD